MAVSPYDIDRRSGTTYRPRAAATTTRTTTPYASRSTYAYTPNKWNDPKNWYKSGGFDPARGYEKRELNAEFDLSGLPGLFPDDPYGDRNPNGPGGGGGRGGGGGGAPPIDASAVLALLNRKPQGYQWQNMQFNPYVGPEFYAFDQSIYDRAKSGLGEAVAADRAAGNASYNQLGTEMAAYQNPWANPSTVQNPAMSAAMQRMMQANATPASVNQADINQGVQADRAFGNLGATLGMIAQQEQDARLRANAGYQRGFNERLDAEQRGGNLSVDMQMAAARRQYDQDRWAYGESVARKNYDANLANIQYNNQGMNQTAQANAQLMNDWQSTGVKTLIDLLASGAKIDPAQLAQIGATA